MLTGGKRAQLGGEIAEGYYVEPTIFEGNNKMRVFQEEIFGPVVSVTKFKNDEEALAIANDTLYGLGAGVWTRNGNRAYKFGRAIQAGRVWTNCYHAYPAHAAFGGIQGVRHRPREPQDDARPLPEHQERPGQLRHQGAWLLLASDTAQARETPAPVCCQEDCRPGYCEETKDQGDGQAGRNHRRGG